MMNSMNDPTIRFNELIILLKDRGYRMTPQRLELIRFIAASDGHPSASQIFEAMRNQFPTMSQATVYNTLALLKDMHQVLEINLHGDSHYDGNRPEQHPHIICIECNRIIDGNWEYEDTVIANLEQETGFKIIRSQIAFFGLCPECKEKNL